MSDARQLYLELLKKTLSYALWDEPSVPIEAFGHSRSRARQLAVQLAAGVARRFHLELHREPAPANEEAREQGQIRPMVAHTMIGRKRLDNLQACVERVISDGVPGDLIEAGVWRGGAAILMRGVLAAYEVADRRVFVADSFAGLPRPDPARYPADAGDQHHRNRFLAVPRAEVEENFRRYGLLDAQVVFLEGWFRDTLPAAPTQKLAILRIDSDMYQSTIETLEALYPRLVGGGYCIVDDYALPACRRAVDDYRSRSGVTEVLERIDYTGVFWRKTGRV